MISLPQKGICRATTLLTEREAGRIDSWSSSGIPKKRRKTFRAHGVSFDEAATTFGDPLGVTAPDPDHSRGKERFLTVGLSSLGRLVMVAHTDRNERIRIISARILSRMERKAYEEETKE